MADVTLDIDARLAQLQQLEFQQLQGLKLATAQLVIQLNSINTVFSAVSTLLKKPEPGPSKIDLVFKLIARTFVQLTGNAQKQNQFQVVTRYFAEVVLIKVLQRQWQHCFQKK
jgi:hypothetical protein